jgi:hypothetical protein
MAMHQTTLRFSPDVWAALDEEASRLGVSAAQYIREAAVARLTYGMGRRGDREFERAVLEASGHSAAVEWYVDSRPGERREQATDPRRQLDRPGEAGGA